LDLKREGIKCEKYVYIYKVILLKTK